VLAEAALTRLAVEVVVALLMAQAARVAQEITRKALVAEVAGAGTVEIILHLLKVQAVAAGYLTAAMAAMALTVVAAAEELAVLEGRRSLLTLAATGEWVYAIPATVTPFLDILPLYHLGLLEIARPEVNMPQQVGFQF
jgi:hypothetical protein